MNVSECEIGKKILLASEISQKIKIDLSAETEKYFVEREHLIFRPAANLLDKLGEVI